MSRNLDSALASHFAGAVVYPIFLLRADFDSGTLRLWTGYGDLTWNGATFTGAGEVLNLDLPDETLSLEANGAEATLTGIDSSLVATALAEDYQERPATIWVAALDGGQNLLPPYPVYAGRIDTMQIKSSGDEADIGVTIEQPLISFKSQRGSRYTPEDQKRRFPDDEGLAQVPTLNDGRQITWGAGQ